MTEQERMSNHSTRLNDAIAAARAGRRDEAVRLLRQITADDPFNVDAWVWLGGLADDPREQRAALEQALVIQPEHPRAQQGLDWLRQRHPEVFDDASAPSATTDAGARVYEAPVAAAPAAETMPASSDAATTEVAPTYRAQAAATEAPTQPMPVFYQPQPAGVAPTYQAQAATDRMAVPPPPPQTAPEVRPRRHPGAELARALLALLWLAGLGAAATLAGLILAYPQRFEPLVNSLLAPYNRQLVPALVPATRLGTTVALVALALVDALVALGLIARWRWTWALNLLVALLMAGGTVALGVALVGLLGTPPDALLTAPAGRALLGLAVFTAFYLILSFASRRAFFRRSETTHGR